MKRIGVISGTFNPINDQDIIVAKEYLKALNLDQIAFELIDNDNLIQRINMVKLAIKPYRKLELLTKRSKKDIAYIELNDTRFDHGLMSDDFSKIPDVVAHYAIDNCLYIDGVMHRLVSEKRYRHVQSVANIASEIAEHYGLNVYHAKVAGYLHDLTKEYPKEEQKRLIMIYFPTYADRSPKIFHQYTAGIVAKTRFKINDSNIIDAISNHVNGTDSKLLSRIIFCCDKIDDTRGFDNAYLKQLCIDDMDQAYLIIRNKQIEHLSRSIK